MIFESIPILEKMKEFYALPRDRKRFDTYLKLMLNDTKEDVELPIAAYNPMGKELVIRKLNELIELEAEVLLENEVLEINKKHSINDGRKIKVAISIVDDMEGAWSNKWVTDYKSKFDFDSLLKRNFCLPTFWSSETLSKEKVSNRVKSYLYRTLYWIDHGKPETLQEHINQELYVESMQEELPQKSLGSDFVRFMKGELNKNHLSTNYGYIVNFFYGDEACASLNYTTHGFEENAGFKFLKSLL